MKKQTICGLVLVVAVPLCAQGWLYSPRHLNTNNEGRYYSYYFAGFANGRHQLGDGENRQAALITAVSVRRDGWVNYSESAGMGRKWTNVKVSIGEGSEGSIEKFTETFSSNFMTTPAVVFNSVWSLPTLTGLSTTRPNPYGGVKGEYRIPFSPPFAYSGKGDIVHDRQFSEENPEAGHRRGSQRALLTRHGLALPTEAQWERSCRAETTTPWSTGRTRASLEGYANLLDRTARNVQPFLRGGEAFDDRFKGPAPVGTFAPNAFGLYGMHGNVAEWCRDWFQNKYLVPERPGDGMSRTRRQTLTGTFSPIRGGSCSGDARKARSAMRWATSSLNKATHLGVRPARAVTR